MRLVAETTDLEILVAKCRRKDSRAWGQLVEQFQNLVYSIPRRYGLSNDDCNDVFQSTFQALVNHLDRIENPATLPKWLAVTASRESLRIIRISKKTTNLEEFDMTLDTLVASEEDSAEENAIAAERADLVRQAVAELPDRCRQLISMLYLADETSYDEISEKLKMPLGAIGPTRARCLDKVRKILEREKFC